MNGLLLLLRSLVVVGFLINPLTRGLKFLFFKEEEEPAFIPMAITKDEEDSLSQIPRRRTHRVYRRVHNKDYKCRLKSNKRVL